jgi:hypothetical protein
MNEESKIAIVSHGAIVEFNPNSVEHRKILTDVTQGLMKNELELDRQSNLFIELVSNFSRAKISAQPFDTERHLTEFFKSTGVVVPQYLLLEAATIPPHDKVGDFYLVWRRGKFIKPGIPEFPSLDKLKVGDTIKCWDGADIPIVAIHTHCPKSLFKTFEHRINTRNDFSAAVPDGLEIVWPQDRFNTDFPAIREAINSLKPVLSENGYMDVRRGLVEALNNTYGLKATIQDFVNLIEGNCTPIDFVLKTQSDTPLLQAKAGEDKSSALMVTDSEGMVCFRKPDKLLPGDKIMSFARRSPRPDKKESRNEQSTGRLKHSSRYWYDRFGVGHEIPPNKPMEAGSVKLNEVYGMICQPSSNGEPIPSPDLRDESVRGKDIVVQNSVSITTGKVNMHALEAACRTMAENMKVMHRKPVSDEFRDKLYEALAAFYHRHHSLGAASREFLYGDVICIERFKREFGIVFSAKDVDAFLNGVMPIPELLSKYVRERHPGEKKITTYSQYALALNTLTSLLCLFPPNVRTREDIERAKALHVQFNIRFDIDMTEEDFLAIIYRHGAPRHFLKKHATTEATKGE